MKVLRLAALAGVGVAVMAATAVPATARTRPAIDVTSHSLVAGVDARGDEPAIERALATQLRRVPGGQVHGRTISYRDGSVFVAVASGRESADLCAANRFCAFTESYERGSVWMYGKLGTRRHWTYVRSFENNRDQRTDVWSASGQHRHRLQPHSTLDQVGNGFHTGITIRLRGF